MADEKGRKSVVLTIVNVGLEDDEVGEMCDALSDSANRWFEEQVEEADNDLESVETKTSDDGSADECPEGSLRLLTEIKTGRALADDDLAEMCGEMEEGGREYLEDIGADTAEAEERNLVAVDCRFRRDDDGKWKFEED